MTAGDVGGRASSDRGAAASGTDREPGPATPGGGADPERLVHEGLDHLQRAARETIAAMRTVLDLAEGIVDNPRAAEAMVATLGSFAEAAVRAGTRRDQTRFSATGATAPDDDDDGGRVQRIPVS